MKDQTSAGTWRPRQADSTRQGAATPRPWLDEGYQKSYQWFVARAVFALAGWADMRCRPPQFGEPPFRFKSVSGVLFTIFWLVCSYPFLKKATDITSLRGNAPGVDGVTYYHLFQSPDWSERTLRALRNSLRAGSYWPGAHRQVTIRVGAKARVLHMSAPVRTCGKSAGLKM